jgi:SpoVK/Ycf46/Vps4 family AAA+-type ATPase
LQHFLESQKYKEIVERMRKRYSRSGLTCLLYGGPGTGKTETVYQLARETGRDIMAVDFSQIKSKWVGESEKNIKELFDHYRKLVEKAKVTPILLFNEADAIFGVRMTGAQRSVDKMENSMQNIILQEMETLNGILIATTNLTQNLDAAFERRFLYKVQFERPDESVRARIWHQMLPELSENECKALGRDYDLSGGQIENVARKFTIDGILYGEETRDRLNLLHELCGSECINDNNTNARRVGFVA